MTNSLRDGLGYEELGQVGSQVSNLFLAGSINTTADITTATNMTAVNMSGTTAVRSALVNATNVIGTTAVSGATARFTNMVASTALSGASCLATNVVASTALSGASVNATTANLSNAVLTGSADIPTVYDNTGSPYGVGNVVTSFTADAVISGGMWVTVSGAAGGATVVARPAPASTYPFGVCLATTASGAVPKILTRGPHYFTADGTIANGVAVQMGAGGALNTVQVSTGSTAAHGDTGARGVALAGAGSEGQALIYLF